MPFRLEPVSASPGFRLEPVEAPMSTGAAGKPGAGPEPVTATGAATRALVNRTIQNTLNIPAAAADLLTPTEFPETPAQARIRQAGEAAGIPQIPSPFDLLGRGASAVAEGVRSITPDVSTVAAVPAFFTGGPEGFQRERERILTEDIRQASEAPTATAVGEVAGDALTLLGLRRPFVRGRARAERTAAARETREAAGLVQVSPEAQAAAAAAAERVARLQERGGLLANAASAATSKLAKAIGRGTGRAAQAGLEGAALAQLQGGDVASAAGWATGAQLAQSGILAATIPKSVGDAIFKGAVAFGVLTALGPGQVDVIAATEDGFNKFLLGLGVAGLALATGGGRVSSRNQAVLVDAITAMPRGALQSTIRRIAEADPQTQAVLDRLQRDPMSFTTTQRRVLARAIDNPKLSLDAAVDRLGLR